MKYTLIPDYFQTQLFQETVSDYLDHVIPALLKHKGAARQAKGRYKTHDQRQQSQQQPGQQRAKGRYKTHDQAYDMPYHIHILNGLIPMLYLYERFLLERNGMTDPKTPIYLKVLILGFTFHDANKLSDTPDIPLDKALWEWREEHVAYGLADFFAEYEQYLGDICFLALGTENRTESLKNQFVIQLNYQFLSRTLAPFCHLADSLASVSDLDDLPSIQKAVQKALAQSPGDVPPLSVFRLHRQPYVLLSQRLMMIAREVRHQAGKPVLYATREGFLYWGEPLTVAAQQAIAARMGEPVGEVDALGLVEINFQKCSLGFLGSLPLTAQLTESILRENLQNFLKFSPSRADKFDDFPAFVALLDSLIGCYGWPVALENRSANVYLSPPAKPDENEVWWLRLFCLKKFQWLSKDHVPAWNEDWEAARRDAAPLPSPITTAAGEILTSFADWVRLLSTHTTQTAYLEMLFRSMIWASHIVEEGDEEAWEDCWHQGIADCVEALEPKGAQAGQSGVLGVLAKQWIQGDQTSLRGAFERYAPYVPMRDQMCAFTAGPASRAYQEAGAFALKARGASPHTVTTLKNDTMYVSPAFAEENQLRKTLFPDAKEADMVVYYDFFETSLGIGTDLLRAICKAKSPQVFADSTLEIDNNVRFRYDWMLNFTSLASPRRSASEALFGFVRSHLLMLKDYGIRTYVSGTMSPYRPHRAAFYYEDAPPLLKALGWQEVRLDTLDQVLTEMDLILSFSKRKLTGNLHRLAGSRMTYFRLFYEEDRERQQALLSPLYDFIVQYPNLFPSMTTMDHLVSLALPLKLGFRSGADETGLIRTALHYLRVNLKEGRSREQTIQQMAASIDRDLKSETKGSKHEQALAFATAVYDELYVSAWHATLLSINREKDWIYQFGFLFRIASYEVLDQKRAEQVREWLESKNLPPTLENVMAWIEQYGKARQAQAPYILALLTNSTEA